jgi:putative transposase
MKGKNAISIARTYMGRRKHFTGQSFWARGYYVSKMLFSRYLGIQTI